MSAAELTGQVYDALRTGDRPGLAALLAPGFEAWFTAGLPDPIGGFHQGVDDCIDRGWWAIGARYAVRAEPEQDIACTDGSLLVLGTYRGSERRTGRRFEAAFAHHWTTDGKLLTSLRQFTDSAAWLGSGEGAPA